MAIESNNICKIIVVGDPGVGKTSLVQRYCQNAFSTERKVTIGVDFGVKELEINGKVVTLRFWDTAGQERYSPTIPRMYFKDAHGAFVVCDKSKKDTLLSVSAWKNSIDKHVSSPIPAILLANKCDLIDKCECTSEEIQKKAQELDFEASFETSALEKKGFDEAIVELVKKILAKPAPVVSTPQVTLEPKAPRQQNTCSC